MVFEDERRRVRRWLVSPRGSPPQGRRLSALSEAGEAPAGGCGRQSRAPDHWRALECRSQRPVKRHWGRKGRPRQVTGLWQWTRRAVSGGISAVCSSWAQLAV